MTFVPLRRILVALLFLITAAAPQRLSAQAPTGVISGRVTAANSDSVLAGVDVLLTDLGLALRTDRLGRYEFRGLPAGRHTILARAVGRGAVRAVIELGSGESRTWDFALRTSVLTVADITVSATRDAQSLQRTPLAIGVVDASDIAAARAHHPAELVTRTPGVWVANLGGEGHQTSIRQPITTKAVYQFLEDGVPIRSTGFFNHNGLYEINLPQSGRIEVIKGPGSAAYGSDAIGGAVNSYTRDPSLAPTMELSLEGGQAGYRRGMGTVSTTFGAHGLRADVNITDADGWRTGAAYARQSGTLRWDVRAGEQARLKTIVSASHIDQPSDGGSDLTRGDFDTLPETNYSPITYREVKALRWSTEYQRQAGLGSVGATLYARYNELDIMPSWQLSYDPQTWVSKNNSIGTLLRLRRALPGIRSTLATGVDAELSPGSEFERRVVATKTGAVYTSYTQADVQYDYDVTFWQTSPYAQLDVIPGDRFTLQLGARYDRLGYSYETHLAVEDTGSHRIPASTDVSFSRLTPKIGATYQLAPGWSLYAGYRGAFRVPSQSQLFRQGSAVSTVDLKPVRAGNLEAGVKAQVGGVAAFEVTVYQLRLHDDILTFQDSTGLRTAVNAGETRSTGLETGVDLLPIPAFRVNATATWGHHEYVTWKPSANVTQDLSGNGMELAPRFFGSLRLTWMPSWLRTGSVTAEWVKMGRYWQDPQNTHEYEGHTVASLYGTVPVTHQLDIVARATNLFNTRFAETSSYTVAGGERLRPGQPRAVFVSAVYRIGR